MLMAAAPSEPTALDLFKLALELVERKQLQRTTELDDYFQQVLQSAKQLVTAPQNAAGLNAEVIELALALAANHELASDLCNVSSLSDLSPQMAGKVLREMDSRIAA
ncbi:hypothetical protein [Acidocella sp.]|jgi:hypothetical protein|uniref:hypothetical protein n=1 Tax=Acidocella sp. TaxID=50710 RepID=UPI002F42ABFE